MSPRQFAKLVPVIVATAALSTLTLNVDAAQVHPAVSAEMENPKLPESSRPSAVPTGAQLAADATDGTTNAHTANTTPKNDKLFLEITFNISTLLVNPSKALGYMGSSSTRSVVLLDSNEVNDRSQPPLCRRQMATAKPSLEIAGIA
jgi:hypothetical protein